MKNLVVVIALSFILATNVSAERNRKHGNSHNNHQMGISKHISKQSRHYYNRHNHHNRHYVSYSRPYRHGYYPRYYSNYDVVIISPGLLFGF